MLFAVIKQFVAKAPIVMPDVWYPLIVFPVIARPITRVATMPFKAVTRPEDEIKFPLIATPLTPPATAEPSM